MTPYDRLEEDEISFMETGKYLHEEKKLKTLTFEDHDFALRCVERYNKIINDYSDVRNIENKCRKSNEVIALGIAFCKEDVYRDIIKVLGKIEADCNEEATDIAFNIHSCDSPATKEEKERLGKYHKIFDEAELLQNDIWSYVNDHELWDNRARDKYPNLSYLLDGFETKLYGYTYENKWNDNFPENEEVLCICEETLKHCREYLNEFIRLDNNADKVEFNQAFHMNIMIKRHNSSMDSNNLEEKIESRTYEWFMGEITDEKFIEDINNFMVQVRERNYEAQMESYGIETEPKKSKSLDER